jgi:hypothetical protein
MEVISVNSGLMCVALILFIVCCIVWLTNEIYSGISKMIKMLLELEDKNRPT